MPSLVGGLRWWPSNSRVRFCHIAQHWLTCDLTEDLKALVCRVCKSSRQEQPDCINATVLPPHDLQETFEKAHGPASYAGGAHPMQDKTPCCTATVIGKDGLPDLHASVKQSLGKDVSSWVTLEVWACVNVHGEQVLPAEDIGLLAACLVQEASAVLGSWD